MWVALFLINRLILIHLKSLPHIFQCEKHVFSIVLELRKRASKLFDDQESRLQKLFVARAFLQISRVILPG